MAFIMLKPWDERSKENSVFALAQRAQQHFFTFRDAMVFAFAPPAVLELGNATGEHGGHGVGFFLQQVLTHLVNHHLGTLGTRTGWATRCAHG